MNLDQVTFQYDDRFLVHELNYIHQEIFGETPSLIFTDHYLKLNHEIFKNITAPEKHFLLSLVSSKSSLEAIEIVKRRQFPILGKKINSVIYIAESLIEYEDYFYASSASRLTSIFKIAQIVIRFPFFYIYGLFLVKKNGL
jgi:hypothetical protein